LFWSGVSIGFQKACHCRVKRFENMTTCDMGAKGGKKFLGLFGGVVRLSHPQPKEA
jgi:hypothetical protein